MFAMTDMPKIVRAIIGMPIAICALRPSSFERRAKRAGCGRVGREISAFATSSFQFAKAGSAATLSQQE
jgi:hypothetical protein